MSRERKTVDCWRLYVDYGYGDGFEHELTEYTPQDARQRRKEYAENCPQYATKIVKGRERVVKRYFYGAHANGGYKPACGILRVDCDPEGKYKAIYVYGRELSAEEKRRAELEYIKEEEVA